MMFSKEVSYQFSFLKCCLKLYTKKPMGIGRQGEGQGREERRGENRRGEEMREQEREQELRSGAEERREEYQGRGGSARGSGR